MWGKKTKNKSLQFTICLFIRCFIYTSSHRYIVSKTEDIPTIPMLGPDEKSLQNIVSLPVLSTYHKKNDMLQGSLHFEGYILIQDGYIIWLKWNNQFFKITPKNCNKITIGPFHSLSFNSKIKCLTLIKDDKKYLLSHEDTLEI
jgi:hypothetical protein